MRTGTIRLGAERVKNRTAKTVVVPGEVRDILARRWEARQGPWVFHRSGRPVKHFRKAWDCAVGRLGRPELIPHDLRRSYARNAIQSGVDPKRVMECGGWLTMSVLFRYQIISEQEIKAALERTADYVTEAVKKAEREAAPAPAVFPDEPAAILSGPAPERPTVRWVLEFQIATLALTDKKRADTMRGQISRILVLLGDREAATIVQADFDAYRTARRGITHLGKPPTERTIIRELQWLGQALREHAKRTGGDPGAVPKSGTGRRGGRPRKEGP
jgi:hypothetical protein